MSTRFHLVASLGGLLAALGCGSPSAPGGDPVPAALVIDRGPVPMRFDPASIDGARIEGDQLVLFLSHAGGCRTHRFSLHLVLPVPPQAEPFLELTLSHDADGDLCEALLHPVLRIDLRALHPVLAPRRAARLRIYRPGAASPSADLRYSF